MQNIGIYKVEDKPLGQGGMGQVLRGYTPDGRTVAIKEILPQFVADPEYRVRIEAEISFLKKFDHPYVVHIYDHFEQEGRLYIVMELVEGDNLEEYVGKHGPIPWRQVITYMSNILHAMEHVHQREVIHRDIKPGNIMIRPDGSVCLLDFGVAKAGSTVSNVGTHTVLGSIIGTDGYMSPEQAGGYAIDYRADIYALGCVMFFMLTGRHAYPRLDSDFETQYAILNKPFPRLKDVHGGFPPELQEIIDGAVDRNMMKRYQSCGEFRARLNRISGEDVSITIGREGCDIIINPGNTRVSRMHATLTRKNHTGGTVYIYTDKSTNGTLINNAVYTRGMSYNFRRGQRPVILLAGDPASRLDIAAAVDILDAKAGGSPVDTDGSVNDAGYEAPAAHDLPDTAPSKHGVSTAAGSGIRIPLDFSDRFYSNSRSMGKAISNFFRRYADFKGRSGRGDFWYWSLFNFLLMVLCAVIAFFLDQNYISVIPVVAVEALWSLATFVPSMALGVRRMHDTGRSGWIFFLLAIFSFVLVPAIVLIVFFCQKSENAPNRYGPGPRYSRSR